MNESTPRSKKPPKDYRGDYSTPYYDELKRNGIHLPCFLTHIRTDAARIEKPKDARMFRMMFTPPRVDGCCGTIDTRPLSNLIMEWKLIPHTPKHSESEG